MTAKTGFEISPGTGIRVLVNGELYTVDDVLEGDLVLRPVGGKDNVRAGPEAPTVELHFVPPDDKMADVYTTGSDRS